VAIGHGHRVVAALLLADDPPPRWMSSTQRILAIVEGLARSGAGACCSSTHDLAVW